ncbi:MAG: DUF2283 domain-containing protein [Dehalococcoidia bacterium]
MGAFRPHATFDPAADAIYVYLSDVKVARTTSVDDSRIIDYSVDGGIVGVELLRVGGGIDLSDIPCSETVEELIGELGLGI